MEEKDIVLDTSLRFLDLLRTSGENGGRNWTAEITRDTDVFISLSARSAYANAMGADRFLSIHANAFDDPQANGTETFSSNEPSTSSEMRDLIQEEMIAEWQLRDRGGKTANFSVLTNTAMPATLSELGFITNPGDAALLADLDARQRAAEAHLRALNRHFEGVPEPLPPKGSILVQVILNNEPLQDIPITLDGQAAGVTDDNGSLLLEDLELGTYQLTATLTGFAPFDISVVVGAEAVARGLFELEETPSEPTSQGCGCSQANSSNGTTFWILCLAALYLLGRRRRWC